MVVFSVPISVTPAVIREYAALLDPQRQVPLWMDVTSLKAPAAAAFKETQPKIEAVGLHPMCAPPPTPSLSGRVLVVCDNGPRERWGAWFKGFLSKVGGRQVKLEASQHDKLMSLVQAGCHAGWLAQAKLWSHIVPNLGGLGQVRHAPIRGSWKHHLNRIMAASCSANAIVCALGESALSDPVRQP